MQRYRLPLTREVPIPSDEEALLPQPITYYYLASEVDARIAKLEKVVAAIPAYMLDPADEFYCAALAEAHSLMER
jgi:hypothetical protein